MLRSTNKASGAFVESNTAQYKVSNGSGTQTNVMSVQQTQIRNTATADSLTLTPNQIQIYTTSYNTQSITAQGFNGQVYHSDQPTTNQTYYLTFVQAINSGSTYSGYYPPCFDSATLTYNPNTNLLLVNGLQLGTATNNITSFTGGTLTLEANNASSREFNFPITANMTGLVMNNRRVNGTYKCNISNSSGSSWTISSTLTGSNKTSFTTATISVGQTLVMTIRTLSFAGTTYNCVDLVPYV